MAKTTIAQLEQEAAKRDALIEQLKKQLAQSARVVIRPPKDGKQFWHVAMQGVSAKSANTGKFYNPCIQMPLEAIEYLSQPDTHQHFVEAIANYNKKANA
jgi:dTDP-4-amino-4,6-dideoxygalactose transaminase